MSKEQEQPQSLKSRVIRGLLFLVGLGVFVSGVFGIYTKLKNGPQPVNNEVLSTERVYEIVMDQDTEFLQKINGLKTLSIGNDVRAFEIAKEWSQSDKIELRIGAFEVLYPTLNVEEKEKAIQDLLGYLKNGNDASLLALNALIQVAPKNAEFIERLKSIVIHSSHEQMRSSAILHLSFLRDGWMVENIQFYLKEKESAPVKLAAIKGLPLACPADRWRILHEFIMRENKDDLMRAALAAPYSLGGAAAPDFLKKLILSGVLKPKQNIYAGEVLKQMEQTPLADCDVR